MHIWTKSTSVKINTSPGPEINITIKKEVPRFKEI